MDCSGCSHLLELVLSAQQAVIFRAKGCGLLRVRWGGRGAEGRGEMGGEGGGEEGRGGWWGTWRAIEGAAAELLSVWRACVFSIVWQETLWVRYPAAMCLDL